MAWSTRELADLAGTTVNAVRHYHREGLLEEPDRRANGYKQYEVRHLLRLLHILRLRDLGVPVNRIDQVGGDTGTSADALAAIDRDLAASIERLQRARAEIRAVLEGATVTDVPAGFELVAPQLSTTDRALMLIYSRLYDDAAMDDMRRMLEAGRDDAEDAFDALPPDAEEGERQRVAEALAPAMLQSLVDYPWMVDPRNHLSRSFATTEETMTASFLALYNAAQLDVLGRAGALARARLEAAGDEGSSRG